MSIPEKILAAVFIAAMVVAFGFALKIGLDKSEKAECLKWREEAREFPLWYSTEWQREQCEFHGLPLPK